MKYNKQLDQGGGNRGNEQLNHDWPKVWIWGVKGRGVKVNSKVVHTLELFMVRLWGLVGIIMYRGKGTPTFKSFTLIMFCLRGISFTPPPHWPTLGLPNQNLCVNEEGSTTITTP